jgi:hypothetical protein
MAGVPAAQIGSPSQFLTKCARIAVLQAIAMTTTDVLVPFLGLFLAGFALLLVNMSNASPNV